MILGACWPIALILLAAMLASAREIVHERVKHNHAFLASRGYWNALRRGAERTLPLLLVVTFVMVPSTATLIFKTFLCDRVEYDDHEARRYLHDDLAMRCDTDVEGVNYSDEYMRTRTIAFILVAVWPIGGGWALKRVATAPACTHNPDKSLFPTFCFCSPGHVCRSAMAKSRSPRVEEALISQPRDCFPVGRLRRDGPRHLLVGTARDVPQAHPQ
jgi:hypothetical protein